MSIILKKAKEQIQVSITNLFKEFRIVTWLIWKILQVFFRSHTSHLFALILAICVIIRELPELLFHSEGFSGFWFLFISLITLFTVIAAIWEFRGNKLPTTLQERLFIFGIRNLFIELEKFKLKCHDLNHQQSSEEFRNTFSNNFIAFVGGAICGIKDVDVGIMIYDVINEKEGLYLYASSKNARYPKDFFVPLSDVKDFEKGPAYMAFTTGLIAHMPNKNKKGKFGYLFQEIEGESYAFNEHFQGWYPSTNEKFRSVLSIPIFYDDKIYGVLNFTTSCLDPFVTRDYIMGLSFASFLAEAIVFIDNKKRSTV